MCWTQAVIELDERHERVAGYLEREAAWGYGPPTLGRIAEDLGLDLLTAVSLLYPMQELGLVERVRGEGEERYKVSSRTPVIGEIS